MMEDFERSESLRCSFGKANIVLKQHVRQLIDLVYPIRRTTHAIIHLLYDVKIFQRGIECLSAFQKLLWFLQKIYVFQAINRWNK